MLSREKGTKHTQARQTVLMEHRNSNLIKESDSTGGKHYIEPNRPWLRGGKKCSATNLELQAEATHPSTETARK